MKERKTEISRYQGTRDRRYKTRKMMKKRGWNWRCTIQGWRWFKSCLLDERLKSHWRKKGRSLKRMQTLWTQENPQFSREGTCQDHKHKTKIKIKMWKVKKLEDPEQLLCFGISVEDLVNFQWIVICLDRTKEQETTDKEQEGLLLTSLDLLIC